MARLPGVIIDPPRWWLSIEYVGLYIIFPVVVYLNRYTFAKLVIPTLVITGAVLFALLWFDPDFDRKQLWNRNDFWERVGRSLLRFGIGSAVLTCVVALTRPDLLLSFARDNFRLWILIMIAYPVWSVYPQEVIFRAYPFHRYRSIFVYDSWMVLASAIGFSLAHLMFANWLAMALSTIGGFLFADTYNRTKSTLQAGIEHALWGDFIFSIGLGWYFYGGSVVESVPLG